MKILLYTEGYKTISKSGLGKAIKHQIQALEDNKIDYTTNLKDDYDILHINFYGPKSYFYAKKMRKKGKKIVYHAHSTEEDFRNSFLFSNLVAPLFKKWICTCYKLGDMIVTPTEYSKRLLENYQLDRPVVAISNGIDTTFFEKDEKNGESFRRKYHFKKSDKVIVGIGLYIERKGILDFVELAKRLPQYKFIWFGYSPLWASPRKIKKAVNTKLDNLIFAGYVDSKMIRNALSGADLYLFPTLEETEGIPIIEALTSKIPTLVRDIPVFEEYEDKKVVYKAKDLDSFEENIKLILEGKLPSLEEEGYKLAKTKDIKSVGKKLIDVYKETLEIERKEEKKPNYQYFRNLSLILGTMVFCLMMMFSSKGFSNLNKYMDTKKEYSKEIEFMDTNITIKVYTDSEDSANKAFVAVEEVYEYYDELTDTDDSDSALYKLNNNDLKDEYITIDNNLYSMIEYGIDWYYKSNGVININNGELIDLWDKYKDLKKVPSEDDLKDIDKDIKDIVLKDDNKIKNNKLNINLDYIKKGYATNKAERTLSVLGINSYIINAGDLIAVGDYYKLNGKYKLSITSPYNNDNSLLTTVNLNNYSVASGSLYQDYYEVDDKIYSSYINSKTNKPSNDIIGVSVVGANTTDTYVFSKLLMMLPLDKGKELIEVNNNMEATWYYLDDDSNKVNEKSSHFKDFE